PAGAGFLRIVTSGLRRTRCAIPARRRPDTPHQIAAEGAGHPCPDSLRRVGSGRGREGAAPASADVRDRTTASSRAGSRWPPIGGPERAPTSLGRMTNSRAEAAYRRSVAAFRNPTLELLHGRQAPFVVTALSMVFTADRPAVTI